MPKARRAHGSARSKPRVKHSQLKLRQATIRAAREQPGQGDETWFKREIALKLDAFSLKEIATATGLSLAP